MQNFNRMSLQLLTDLSSLFHNSKFSVGSHTLDFMFNGSLEYVDEIMYVIDLIDCTLI